VVDPDIVAGTGIAEQVKADYVGSVGIFVVKTVVHSSDTEVAAMVLRPQFVVVDTAVGIAADMTVLDMGDRWRAVVEAVKHVVVIDRRKPGVDRCGSHYTAATAGCHDRSSCRATV
jgi:hypothetical protein